MSGQKEGKFCTIKKRDNTTWMYNLFWEVEEEKICCCVCVGWRISFIKTFAFSIAIEWC